MTLLDGTSQTLDQLFDYRRFALLMRHAERPPIPPGSFGNELPLTDAGKHAALDLGRRLGTSLRATWSSPVLRCLQTTKAVSEGAGFAGDPVLDRRLGDPGAMISDPSMVGDVFHVHGSEGVVERLLHEARPLPGFRAPGEGTALVVESMVGSLPGRGGTLLVTHDSVLAIVVAVVFGDSAIFGPGRWPDFLEGLGMYEGQDGRLLFVWRGETAWWSTGEVA